MLGLKDVQAFAGTNRGHITGVATGHMCEVQLTKRFSLAYASGCEAAAAASKCAGSCPAKTQHATRLDTNNHNKRHDSDGNGRHVIMIETMGDNEVVTNVVTVPSLFMTCQIQAEHTFLYKAHGQVEWCDEAAGREAAQTSADIT